MQQDLERLHGVFIDASHFLEAIKSLVGGLGHWQLYLEVRQGPQGLPVHHGYVKLPPRRGLVQRLAFRDGYGSTTYL